jgi:beta-phosphoglucomutase-like phosphatase (HAD superfamily)
MDGVLINSELLHERAKRQAFEEAGIVVPESLFATYKGRSDKAKIYEVAAAHGERKALFDCERDQRGLEHGPRRRAIRKPVLRER